MITSGSQQAARTSGAKPHRRFSRHCAIKKIAQSSKCAGVTLQRLCRSKAGSNSERSIADHLQVRWRRRPRAKPLHLGYGESTIEEADLIDHTLKPVATGPISSQEQG